MAEINTNGENKKMKQQIEKRLSEMREDLGYWQSEWEKKANNNDWNNMEYEGLKIAMLKHSIDEFEKLLKTS
jgi:hypothetical protein